MYLEHRQNHILDRIHRLEHSVALSPEEQLEARMSRLLSRINISSRAMGLDSCRFEVSTARFMQDDPGPNCAKNNAGIDEPQSQEGSSREGDSSPTQKHLHTELTQKGFSSFRFVRVPPDYYRRTLEGRKEILGAASVDHLWKTIIMENTRAHPSVLHEDPLSPANWACPWNSRYYLVMVQYSARLHAEKLKKLVYRFNEGQVGKQYFNMRLAPEAVSDALSGYEHNAVTPIGMRSMLPMIISHHIITLRPDFFFMGAGEVDLKVGVKTGEFLEKYRATVADVTY